MTKQISTWLQWIADQQPAEMLLGLDRVKIVAERLGGLKLNCPVITVGGTNGKGSTVAGLDAIYRTVGYRVGTFTSPILFRHNEYAHINGEEASDELFCAAYQAIADVKGEVTLTPFEFHTLAALWMFVRCNLDVLILEIGLGGRLDAVNIIDADVAIVTSIAIDHADWLGDTREKIAYEKAGIFRCNKPAICGDENPPKTLIEQAEKIGAKLYIAQTQSEPRVLSSGIKPSNLSCVLKAINLLQNKLPVTQEDIDIGLKNINITGRVQVIPGDITEIYDVSHNPAAIAYLAKRLQEMPCTGKTVAVFSMLADKDINESVKQIAQQIDEWYIAPLTVNRAANLEQLLSAFKNIKNNILTCDTIKNAYNAAKTLAKEGDRIVIFGSFNTVSAILKHD